MKDGEWAETAHFSNGLPSPDKDLIFNARWGRILGNSTLEVNNLRIMTVSDKSFIQTVANGGAGTINQEDLIFSGDFDYNTYVAPNLIVNGNITVEKGTASDNIEVFIGSGEHKAGFAHVKVGGDVDLGNVKNLRFAGSHTEKYGENNYAVDIGGKVYNRISGSGGQNLSWGRLDRKDPRRQRLQRCQQIFGDEVHNGRHFWRRQQTDFAP